MKKKMILMLVFVLMALTPLTAFAKGFSGGSFGSRSSYHAPSASHGSFSSQTNGSTYHSGYRSPSSNVTNSSRQTYGSGINTTSRTRGILSHAAAFGAGALLGSMFHPFRGYYGGVPSGGFIVDILVIILIFWVVRKLFFRRV